MALRNSEGRTVSLKLLSFYIVFLVGLISLTHKVHGGRQTPVHAKTWRNTPEGQISQICLPNSLLSLFLLAIFHLPWAASLIPSHSITSTSLAESQFEPFSGCIHLLNVIVFVFRIAQRKTSP